MAQLWNEHKTRLPPRLSRLRRIKDSLGGLVFVEYNGLSLAQAHRKLGEEVGGQIYLSLAVTLDGLKEGQLPELIRVSRRCRLALEEKSRSSAVAPRIQEVLGEYMECLSAWGTGAQIEGFRHPSIDGIQVDGEPVSASDLAFLLQNDSVGCQTGVYRDADGSVIFWHTEESLDEVPSYRFDQVRVVSFRVADGGRIDTITALVYPDLLPGPAFAWRNNDFIQGIDTLLIKQDPRNGSLFANVASWITLRLGNEVPVEAIIQALGPFYGGYAITTVERKAGTVNAGKVEFTAGMVLQDTLAHDAGSFLFQVNAISQKDSSMAVEYEALTPQWRRIFEGRYARTERAMDRVRASGDRMRALFELIASRDGGEFAYASQYVKAYILARVSSEGMHLWLESGAAMKQDKPQTILLPGT